MDQVKLCDLFLDFAKNKKLPEDYIEQFYEHPTSKQILRKLPYSFYNKRLFFTALVHRSFSNEIQIESNERLEFLGDSIIGAIVSDILFKKFPGNSEGEYSKMKWAAVNETALYNLAVELGLYDAILVGKGENKNDGHARKSILSDAFEALFAAIYLDSNFETVHALASILLEKLDWIELSKNDPKSALQEKTMALYKTLPVYKSEDIQKGKKSSFRVSVFINGKEIETVENISKKDAEKILAEKALKKLEKASC